MGYELRFESLLNTGRGFSFPCDEHGHVDLNGLSDKARINYLFARGEVGRDLACPVVKVSDLGSMLDRLDATKSNGVASDRAG